MSNLLSLITFIPLVAAVILALLARGDGEASQRNVKYLALAATGFTFLASLMLLSGFEPNDTGFQFVEERSWLLGMQYKMGVDGISLLFVLLTTFTMPLVVAASWNVTHRLKEYMIAFLVLESLMIGVFCALDLVLFYMFFEACLIPMFLIIGIWGGKERIYASFKFFLYTFLGSVLMLVAMVAMFADAGTTDMVVLLSHNFGSDTLTVAGFSHYWRGADADVVGFLCLIRGENADVAGAHLVARCPCASADGRLCGARGNFAENGRLWISAVLFADVPCGL